MKYPSINKAILSHCDGMQKIMDFLKEHGADHWWDNYRLRKGLELHVRHANDYIEMGALDEDPDDVLYYIWTQEDFDFKVPFHRLQDMLKALKDNQGMSKNRIADNIKIETYVTNQFTMEKRIRCEDYAMDKVTLNIQFRIYIHQPDWRYYD